MSNLINAEDTNFDTLISGDSLTLVDFWASWCAPCLALAPIVEEVAAEFKEQLQVIKVDAQQYKSIAVKFGIRTIPTLIIFRKGEEISRIGNVSKEDLVQWLKNNLNMK